MLADQPESGALATGHVSTPHVFPSEQQIVAAGPQGEAAHHREESREDLQEAQKTKPNIPAIVLLLVLVVCAGGAALWYFNHTPVQRQRRTSASGWRSTASPARSNYTCEHPVRGGQPQVPQPGPDTNPRQPSAEALLIEAKKQFASNPERAQKLLEEALTLNPNNYDCVLSLARLLVSRNDSSGGHTAVQAGIEPEQPCCRGSL